MAGWQTIKLSDVVRTNVSTYSLSDNWEFVNYLDTGNIVTNEIALIQRIELAQGEKLPSRARRKVEIGDIIYSTVRPNQLHYGFIDNIPENFLVSTGFAVLHPEKGKIDAKFLYYLLVQNDITEKLQAIAEQSTSTYPSIKPSDIEDLDFIVPEIKVQRKISNILSAIDKKIELNAQINHNLEEQAKAIFKSWFIDAPECKAWDSVPLKELVVAMRNGDWGKDNPCGNNTEVSYCIRGADIPDVNAGNKGKMPIRYILPKNYEKKHLVEGDIVVEISGGSPTQSTGRCAVISQALLDRCEQKIVCTNFCKALKPLDGYSHFLYYYWTYLYEKGCFFAYENGTTGIKNLDIAGIIENEFLQLPPIEIMEKFNELCDKVASTIFSNGTETECLAQLRDVLLPKLMSGEIDVSEVEV